MKTKNQTTKLVNVEVKSLIGMNVAGFMAQIISPQYLDERDEPPRWRKLKRVITFEERGQKWVEIYWEKTSGDNINYGGTVITKSYIIQFEESEYKKLLKENKREV